MDKHPILLLLAVLLCGGIGLLLVLYPLISNSLYENRQDGVVETYQTAVTGTLPNQKKAQALSAARAYNRQLLSVAQTEEVPADPPKSLLNVTGSGVIATLSIPKLQLSLPVYYGTETETLEHGIGTLEGRSLPVGGTGTHAVLCGHSGLSSAKLFSDLPLMNEGDTFYIDVLGERLTYEVDQIRTVLPEDMGLIAIEPAEDYCTLLTCTPFGVNTHRLLVRGTRVETVMEAETVTTEEVAESVWMQEYLSSLLVSAEVVLALTLVFVLIYLLRRRRRP